MFYIIILHIIEGARVPWNESRNEIPKGVNWPCTIVAALERTSKALSTADISSFLRSFRPFELPLFFLLRLLLYFPPATCRPRVKLAREPSEQFLDPQLSPHSAPFFVFAARIRRPCPRLRYHVAKSGALCRDKSRTLTVWAFLSRPKAQIK